MRPRNEAIKTPPRVQINPTVYNTCCTLTAYRTLFLVPVCVLWNQRTLQSFHHKGLHAYMYNGTVKWERHGNEMGCPGNEAGGALGMRWVMRPAEHSGMTSTSSLHTDQVFNIPYVVPV